jgi:hypothetical protein
VQLEEIDDDQDVSLHDLQARKRAEEQRKMALLLEQTSKIKNLEAKRAASGGQ